MACLLFRGPRGLNLLKGEESETLIWGYATKVVLNTGPKIDVVGIIPNFLLACLTFDWHDTLRRGPPRCSIWMLHGAR